MYLKFTVVSETKQLVLVLLSVLVNTYKLLAIDDLVGSEIPYYVEGKRYKKLVDRWHKNWKWIILPFWFSVNCCLND